jgi:hypothetical protein
MSLIMKLGLQVLVRVGNAAEVHPLEVVEAKPRSRRAGSLLKRSHTHLLQMHSKRSHTHLLQMHSNIYSERSHTHILQTHSIQCL